MSVEQARAFIVQLARAPTLFFDGSEKTGVLEISSVDIQTTRMRVTVSGNKTYSIPLADIGPKVTGQGTSGCGPDMDGYTEIDLNAKLQGFYFVHPTNACWLVQYDNDNPLTRALTAVREGGAHEIDDQESKQFADAFLVLKRAAMLVAQGEEARFQDAARTYLAATVKPQLPESARKYAVQAEGAIHDNDFSAAADYFQQALDVAPWWPEGYYQRAILLSGSDDYGGAIVEMKRYLVLAPAAPNARAAQDKIYDWERKVPTGN